MNKNNIILISMTIILLQSNMALSDLYVYRSEMTGIPSQKNTIIQKKKEEIDKNMCLNEWTKEEKKINNLITFSGDDKPLFYPGYSNNTRVPDKRDDSKLYYDYYRSGSDLWETVEINSIDSLRMYMEYLNGDVKGVNFKHFGPHFMNGGRKSRSVAIQEYGQPFMSVGDTEYYRYAMKDDIINIYEEYWGEVKSDNYDWCQNKGYPTKN